MVISFLPNFAVAFVLLAFQEQYPPEHHAWLRFKPGTWIKNNVVVTIGDSSQQSSQKLTFKEKTDKDYAIEEIDSADGQSKPPVIKRTSLGTIIGKETLKFDRREYPCTISTAKTQGPEGETEMKYWVPAGNKYPMKVVFKQPGFEGEVVAVAIDEKLKVCGREYLCSKLRGKVKVGDADATLTAWLTQNIPGAQARLELKMNTPNGEFVMTVTPTEIHEEQ